MTNDLSPSLATESARFTDYELESYFGTRVGFVGDGSDARLVHGVKEARPALLIALREAPAAFVLADVLGNETLHPGQNALAYANTVIPVYIEPQSSNDRGTWLKHAISGNYICCHNNKTTITIDRKAPGAWEYFKLRPLIRQVDTKRHAVLSEILGSKDGLLSTFVHYAKSDDPFIRAAMTSLLVFLDPASLRTIVDQLSMIPAYETIFPALQRQLGNGRTRFEFQIGARLADQIARYGWEIGDHSYGNPHIIEPKLGRLKIGKYCSTNDFTIILGNHATSTVSSYPFADLARYWPTAQISESLDDHVAKDVSIGNDVWIGNGALVLPGANIGDGAVIGAHAVATGSIPPYSVVVGNPGRVIRYRFSDNQISRLLEIRWWDWPDHKVDRFIPYILGKDVERFLELAGAPADSADHPAKHIDATNNISNIDSSNKTVARLAARLKSLFS